MPEIAVGTNWPCIQPVLVLAYAEGKMVVRQKGKLACLEDKASPGSAKSFERSIDGHVDPRTA